MATRHYSAADTQRCVQPDREHESGKGDADVLAYSRTDAGPVAAFGGGYLADCLPVRTAFLRANPNTGQAITNAIVHGLQRLKTALINHSTAIPPVSTWDGLITPDASHAGIAFRTRQAQTGCPYAHAKDRRRYDTHSPELSAWYMPMIGTLHAMPGHLVRRSDQISTALFADECAAFDLTSI